MSQNISSAGCFNASASFSVGTSNETLSGRSYLLSIPSNYSLDTPAPLILSFHGGGQSPSTQLDLDQLTNSDVNEKYIVIYPEAIDVGYRVGEEEAVLLTNLTLAPRNNGRSPLTAPLTISDS